MPRKAFDGDRLADDVARLHAADNLAPPAARPSLMDAVRAFATFIDTRAKLGWTDPMIATVLTEAGYAIDAATLRSYRKRLRDEGRIGTKAAAPTPSAAVPAPDASVPDAPRAAAVPAGTSPRTGASSQADRTAEKVTGEAAPRAPPVPEPAPRRSYSILGTMPPDKA